MSNSEKRRGRPVATGSNRQTKLAARAARVANGEAVKRGRPKGSKTQAPAVTTPEYVETAE
jgi:hypothetical protein